MNDPKSGRSEDAIFIGGVPQSADARVTALHEYWQSIHPERGLPGRAHFDPVDIPSLLPYLVLLDVQQEPLRFRYRLIGTHVEKLREGDHTGRWLDELHPGFNQQQVFKHLRIVVDEKTPVWRKGIPDFHSRKNFRLREHASFPLAADGETVDMVLTMAITLA